MNAISDRLIRLGSAVRDRIIDSRDFATDAKSAYYQTGDLIYEIDKKVEPIILEFFQNEFCDLRPFKVVAEGLSPTADLVFGNLKETPRYTFIVDPIDGTRCLMYDKRSAWFLAGCAPLNASMGSLQSIEHAALVEIPTSKQNKSDLILADRNRRLRAFSFDLVTRNYHEFFPRPSREKSLMNGFAHVANFFPGTKVLASELMELIAAEFASDECAVGSLIFDDQYISTGGQLVELLLGRDRFCCDLRPLFYQIHYNQGCEPSGARLACHPYDLAGMLAAVMGGVLLTDPWGRPLDAPLDTCTEVAWCGFANERLMSRINPVIQKWLERHGISNKGG